ncbi:MAG: hypothetical protein HYS27_02975 [Deltaproteobacteria bacterium]|nr:hypothetical protein [Deltaproteobacteria bacterium]
MVELSDTEIESVRDPLSETVDFIDSIEAVCVKNAAAISTVGGNMFLSIPGVGCWTLVTQGARPGLFPEATNDEVDVVIMCEEWVLHELLDPAMVVDLGEYADAGVFAADGDFTVFQRLLALAQGGGSMVGVRARKPS